MSNRHYSRTKDSYQGIKVRHLPRSELDDNTMRDLNRYDNRLDHSLRDVDKAKEVMLKSLEKEKNIFIQGGTRSNKKYTVTIPNPGDSRQRRDSTTSQPTGKYQSDTRNKKPTALKNTSSLHSSTAQQPNTSAAGNDITSTGSSHNGGRLTTGGKHNIKDRDRDERRDILAETRDVIDKQNKGEALVEDFFSNHTGPKGQNHVQGQERGNETSVYESNAPSIRVDQVDSGQANGKSSQTSTQPFSFYDDLSSYGRSSGLWDRLSTPKNPSRNLQKREQLEREFSSPALKSRTATPGAPKSAKGTRTLLSTTSGGNTSLLTSPAASTGGGTPVPSASSTISGKSGTRKKTSPVPGVKTKPKPSSKGKLHS